jgi:hypothetical protein
VSGPRSPSVATRSTAHVQKTAAPRPTKTAEASNGRVPAVRRPSAASGSSRDLSGAAGTTRAASSIVRTPTTANRRQSPVASRRRRAPAGQPLRLRRLCPTRSTRALVRDRARARQP